MGTLVRVASAEDIPPGSAKLVEVEGKRIAVFNVDGRFYAIDDSVPPPRRTVVRGRAGGRGGHLPLAPLHIQCDDRSRPECPSAGWREPLFGP